MRELKKTLDLCATEEVMDYCPEFDRVKAILEYSDKNVKPFKKLCFRSGNDSIVNDMVRRLQDCFMEMQLIDADTKQPLPKAHQTLRKILVFLMANTDATYKYNMHDDTHIAHVFEICPLMPKFLTVTLVWELQLDQFFYEALRYTPCWFAFQFFEAASESLKYIEDAKRLLVILEEIIKSLLISIERSSHLHMDIVDQKIIFNKMHDQAIILLRRFNTPDSNKLKSMKKRELQHYWGFSIKHLLQMVLFAFDLYESKSITEPQLDISIYKIGASFQKNQWNKKTQQTDAIQDQKLKIINALLGTLENSVMMVNMSYFIEWVEVDLAPNLTLQQAVGEMAYKVRQRITENAAFEHGVSTILATIEIRPRTFEEIVEGATIGDILRTLDDAKTMPYEQKKKWYDELFKRGSAALDNSECMETIMENIKLITKENCMQIMDLINLNNVYAMCVDNNEEVEKHTDDDDDDSNIENAELILLLQAATKQLSNEDLFELLDYRFKLFGENSKVLTQDSQQLEEHATELFNKCTTNFKLETFLILCLQNPLLLWAKFFNSACNVKEHAKNFRDTVMKNLPASLPFIDKVFKEAVLKRTQPLYFPNIFAELYFLFYKACKSDFLAKFVNGHIKSLLDEESFEALLPLLKALVLITTYDEKPNFEELTAPMLATISYVAECGRWNTKNFDNTRVQIVNLAIDFIKETLNRFMPTITEKDRKWLTSKIGTTCGALNQYYFQKIFTTDQNTQSLVDFLLPVRDRDEVAMKKFLKKTILRCTTAEFMELMSHESVYEHLPIVLLEIADDINSSEQNEKAALNFRYCFSSYLSYVYSKLCDGSSNQDFKLLKTICEIIAAAPKICYEEIFMEALSLLQRLLKTCADESNDTKTQTLKDFQNFVETNMADCGARNIFLKSNEFN